ncbi:MAG TPA: 3-hydroxyacyl-CoA dehydrogenase NAD-binding domain-containing protein [Fimbriimonadaceae bacterium]|nr:3-hydroxyacyl-CoA dehydrogenase NAD-binding domain-containing protein [Fimbriimonadaceae bacterium]
MEGNYGSWLAARNVCVIGAGTMGSGIAAHLANLGFSVTLLDLTMEGVVTAFDRARSLRPPHFYLPEVASSVRLGTISDHLSWAAEADWVCEAVTEDLHAKRRLFSSLEPYLRPDAMITTNTSGLQISLLSEGMSPGFRRRFMGTHFFNPPRYLKLLELIPTEETDPDAVSAMTRFLEERVARRVVLAKDTPGFIANRFGMWAMFHAIHTTEKLRLSIEQIDSITGPFLGRPKSASFRLNDLVGLDVMKSIAENLILRCPHDPHIQNLQTPRSMITLLANGWIGEKTGQGYYKKEGRELVAFDLGTMAYRQRSEPNFPLLDALATKPLGERIRQALTLKDEAGEFLRCHLVPVLHYANYLKEEVSHSVRDFDRVMKWGFGWQMGPFELIDAIGPSHLDLPEGTSFYCDGAIREFDGSFTIIKPEPEYLELAACPEVGGGETYRLRDLGEGVLAVCLSTKMGVISPLVVSELTAFFGSRVGDRLVLTSEGRSFSAGYDLKFLQQAAFEGAYQLIDEELIKLHELGALLGRSSTVAAVFGHCLGAGLELALGCPLIAAHPEANIGLPESRVGLIPGGRGTALTRLHNQESAKRLAEVAMVLTQGTVSVSADHARSLGLLRPSDVTVYHPDRLLYEARRLALEVSPGSIPMWKAIEGPLTGMIDRLQQEARQRQEMSEYDETIGDKIKQVFSRSVSFEDALVRERAEFIDLCSRALTQARIRHMLETGKPLRN